LTGKHLFGGYQLKKYLFYGKVYYEGQLNDYLQEPITHYPMGSCYLQEYVVVENIFLVVLFSRKSNRFYRPASVIEIFLTRDDLREGIPHPAPYCSENPI